MTLLVAGMLYGLLMLAAGVASGEALAERRWQRDIEATNCQECPVRDE